MTDKPMDVNKLREFALKLKCRSGADLEHLPHPDICWADGCTKCFILRWVREALREPGARLSVKQVHALAMIHWPTFAKGDSIVEQYGICSCGLARANGTESYADIWAAHMVDVFSNKQEPGLRMPTGQIGDVPAPGAEAAPPTPFDVNRATFLLFHRKLMSPTASHAAVVQILSECGAAAGESTELRAALAEGVTRMRDFLAEQSNRERRNRAFLIACDAWVNKCEILLAASQERSAPKFLTCLGCGLPEPSCKCKRVPGNENEAMMGQPAGKRGKR